VPTPREHPKPGHERRRPRSVVPVDPVASKDSIGQVPVELLIPARAEGSLCSLVGRTIDKFSTTLSEERVLQLGRTHDETHDRRRRCFASGRCNDLAFSKIRPDVHGLDSHCGGQYPPPDSFPIKSIGLRWFVKSQIRSSDLPPCSHLPFPIIPPRAWMIRSWSLSMSTGIVEIKLDQIDWESVTSSNHRLHSATAGEVTLEA
jgi:hypothetical protein